MTKTDRKHLEAAIRKTEQELAEMRQKFDAYVEAYRHTSEGHKPETTLHRDIGAMESRLKSMQDELARVERLEAHQALVEQSAKTTTEAHQEMKKAEESARKLQAAASEVRAKQAGIREDAAKAIEAAEAAEREAATAYAAAVAGDDPKQEKAALARLEKAQAATAAAKSGSDSQRIALEALEGKAVALEAQAAAAMEQAKEARYRMLEALRTKLGAEWDQRTDEMVTLAGKIAAVENLVEFPSSFRKLWMPVFRPSGIEEIRSYEVAASAAGINVEQLVA